MVVVILYLKKSPEMWEWYQILEELSSSHCYATINSRIMEKIVFIDMFIRQKLSIIISKNCFIAIKILLIL